MRRADRRRPTDLTNKVVVITGGARGIGAATASAFVAAGAVVAVCDIDIETAHRTAERLGSGVTAHHLDVTDPASVAATLDAVETGLGPIDVLVNNAGIMPITDFVDESVESVRRQLDINIAGVIYGTQTALRRMIPRGRGTIVNIASAAGRIGYPGVATYSATKFAVVGLTDTLALEYADSGVEFVCVMPGLVNTELISGVDAHWLLPNQEPASIASAIVDAVRHRRRHVNVPKRLGPLNALHALLPARTTDKVLTLLGADHQLLDGARRPERGDYRRRVGLDVPDTESGTAPAPASAPRPQAQAPVSEAPTSR